MARSEFVANVEGFSCCASKGLQARPVTARKGFNLFKLLGFVAGIVLALVVVF